MGDLTFELLALVATIAGGIIAAFMAGSAMFFQIGKDIGRRNRDFVVHDLRATIARQEVSLRDIDAAMADLRVRNQELENATTEPPSAEQASRLLELFDNSDKDLWLSVPAVKPANHDAFLSSTEMKIISVVNLKGGVGKTTISANLAAHFDKTLQKRVLVIDADYQGSLSDVFMRLARSNDSSARIDEWLSANTTPENLFRHANKLPQLLRTHFVTAFYQLSTIETRLMMRWLVGGLIGQPSADLRYVLSRILHSPAAAERYDVVIIDCPPRLSTTTVNALCASTHVLIPSVPDDTSLEAVTNFTEMASKLAAELNPHLKLAGIVPSMTTNLQINGDEALRLHRAKGLAQHFGGAPHIFEANVPHKKPIADVAGRSIALISGAPSSVKNIFRKLGDEVAAQIGLQRGTT